MLDNQRLRSYIHLGPKEYLLPGAPGFCQNVLGAAAAAAPAAAPAAPGTFWQNPGTPGHRYPSVSILTFFFPSKAVFEAVVTI